MLDVMERFLLGGGVEGGGVGEGGAGGCEGRDRVMGLVGGWGGAAGSGVGVVGGPWEGLRGFLQTLRVL